MKYRSSKWLRFKQIHSSCGIITVWLMSCGCAGMIALCSHISWLPQRALCYSSWLFKVPFSSLCLNPVWKKRKKWTLGVSDTWNPSSGARYRCCFHWGKPQILSTCTLSSFYFPVVALLSLFSFFLCFFSTPLLVLNKTQCREVRFDSLAVRYLVWKLQIHRAKMDLCCCFCSSPPDGRFFLNQTCFHPETV